ncbi:hypothetical protein HK405_002431, partial [Cladochytrium tenue]
MASFDPKAIDLDDGGSEAATAVDEDDDSDARWLRLVLGYTQDAHTFASTTGHNDANDDSHVQQLTAGFQPASREWELSLDHALPPAAGARLAAVLRHPACRFAALTLNSGTLPPSLVGFDFNRFRAAPPPDHPADGDGGAERHLLDNEDLAAALARCRSLRTVELRVGPDAAPTPAARSARAAR